MEILDIAISSITFLTLKEKITLRKKLDSLDDLARLSKTDIAALVGRHSRTAVWNAGETICLCQRSLKLMKQLDIFPLSFFDASYPALLRETFDAPYMIYYRGNLDCLCKKCISMVGTRNASKDSAEGAFSFAKEAALDQNCIVSGLANGIDTFSHRGALASKVTSSTVAVLPCGIDTIVPVGNKKLSQAILQSGGLILSEYIPGCPAEAWRFVQRNRIIAGLSSSTIVVHAPPSSGALITADFAIDFNRDLFFHSSGFTKESLCICEKKKNLLKSSKDAVQRRRADHCAEKYLEEGALVLENYGDFKKAILDQGEKNHAKRDLQLTFFD